MAESARDCLAITVKILSELEKGRLPPDEWFKILRKHAYVMSHVARTQVDRETTSR